MSSSDTDLSVSQLSQSKNDIVERTNEFFNRKDFRGKRLWLAHVPIDISPEYLNGIETRNVATRGKATVRIDVPSATPSSIGRTYSITATPTEGAMLSVPVPKPEQSMLYHYPLAGVLRIERNYLPSTSGGAFIHKQPENSEDMFSSAHQRYLPFGHGEPQVVSSDVSKSKKSKKSKKSQRSSATEAPSIEISDLPKKIKKEKKQKHKSKFSTDSGLSSGGSSIEAEPEIKLEDLAEIKQEIKPEVHLEEEVPEVVSVSKSSRKRKHKHRDVELELEHVEETTTSPSKKRRRKDSN